MLKSAHAVVDSSEASRIEPVEGLDMLGLLFKANKQEKEILDSLRSLKTLRVSDRGGMSIDPQEILESRDFIEASKKAKKTVANG